MYNLKMFILVAVLFSVGAASVISAKIEDPDQRSTHTAIKSGLITQTAILIRGTPLSSQMGTELIRSVTTHERMQLLKTDRLILLRNDAAGAQLKDCSGGRRHSFEESNVFLFVDLRPTWKSQLLPSYFSNDPTLMNSGLCPGESKMKLLLYCTGTRLLCRTWALERGIADYSIQDKSIVHKR
jgi:hypothetical protein